MLLKLQKEWQLGAHLDGGGFGRIFVARPASDLGAPEEFVVKLVPKAPGAERELLFVNNNGARYVVPIIDHGETGTDWAFVMPRAEKSLRKHLEEAGGSLDVQSAVPILLDIATALNDISGKVVHRDLKPENVLLLQGHWCLADFGISRYAEASTAPNTQKFALTSAYAAPERWRFEHATISTDIYSFGVIAFEILNGSPPFRGPTMDDYRRQHLHEDPPTFDNAPPNLRALIGECLYKVPGARPAPDRLVARLEAAQHAPVLEGRARLQRVNVQEIDRVGESARRESQQQSEAERRSDLFRAAKLSFNQISEYLKSALKEDASAANFTVGRDGGWSIRLNQAELFISAASPAPSNPWGLSQPPKFDVITHASIHLRIPVNRHGYEGRSHSLWYSDAQEIGRYGWFETAFMITPLMLESSSMTPFSMHPSESTAGALGRSMTKYQVAWPFTQLVIGNLDEFVDRWVGWFADGAQGLLNHPSRMPERDPKGSWRE